MRNLTILGLLALASAFGQERAWTLPQAPPVKQSGPQSWRFTVDYQNSDVRGRLFRLERVSGVYTRGLPGDAVRWNDVTIAANNDGSEKLPAPQKQEYMEGFSYPHAVGNRTLEADFFRGFPAMAFQARNLVWDTQMFEAFGQEEFEHLKLNEPYRVPDVEELSLAGAGVFRHKDLKLYWSGYSRRNGEECALIDYQAFNNKLDVKTPGLSLTGLSHYWGQIWVSLKTRKIEYATLYEHVAGEMAMPGLEKPMAISVLRTGQFEPVAR